MNEYEIIELKNGNIEISVNISSNEDIVWLTKRYENNSILHTIEILGKYVIL